jgi:predicted SpoU family rRNA methylase
METVVEENVLRPESYVVEIDGKVRSAYGIFVEALKAGLELKQKFPHSRIKVHEADHGRRIEH